MASELTFEEEVQKWQGSRTDRALNTIFSGAANSLLDRFIKDYSAVDEAGTPKKPGWSWGLVGEAIGFFFKHPVDSIVLGWQAREGKLLRQDFQKHLLSKPEIWSFVQGTVADRLPKIAKILPDNPLFKEGGILDENGLGHVQKLLKDDASIKIIQGIAVESRALFPDYGTKIVTPLLQMIAQDASGIRDFLVAKRNAIGTYAKDLNAKVMPADVNRVLTNISYNQQLDDIKNNAGLPDIITKDQVFISDFSTKILQHVNNPNLYTKEVILQEFAKTLKVQEVTIDNINVLFDQAVKAANQSQYVSITNLLQTNLALQSSISDVISRSFQGIPPVPENQDKLMQDIRALPEFNKLTSEQQQSLTSYLDKSVPSVKPLIQEYLDLFEADPAILNHIPSLLTDEMLLVTSKNIQAGLVLVEKALAVIVRDDVLRKFIEDNPTFTANLLKGAIKALPSVNKTTEGFKFDSQICDVISYVKLETAHDILKDLNTSNYQGLTAKLLDALNDPDKGASLREVLSIHANQGLFTNLIDGVLEQNEKSIIAAWKKKQTEESIAGSVDMSGSLRNQMAAYGITTGNLEQITGIVPVLLNRPQDLQKIFQDFSNGKFMDTAKDLILMTASNKELKVYLNNTELLHGVLNKVGETLGLGQDVGQLYDVLPLLLNHPQELVSMIDRAGNGDVTEVAKQFLALVQTDKDIERYFKDKSVIMQTIGEHVAGIKEYGLGGELSSVFSVLASGDNKQYVDALLDRYNKGEWTGLIKDICSFAAESQSFKEYLNINKENFSKIIDVVVDKAPLLKSTMSGYGLETVGKSVAASLINAVLNSPSDIKTLVEGYEDGIGINTGVAAAKVLFKGGIGVATGVASGVARGALNTAYDWISGERPQDFVNTVVSRLSDSIATLEHDQKISMSDFLNHEISRIDSEKQELKERFNDLVSKNTLFNNTTISNSNPDLEILELRNIEFNGRNFINTTFTNVSFPGVKFERCNFTGATFNNVDFTGAIISAETLSSMIPSLKKGNTSLAGAKIVGDLSDLDLSGLNLASADLTGVTAMRRTNLNNTDLQNTILQQQQRILVDAFNIDKAILGTISPDIIHDQKHKLIEFVAEKIAAKNEPMTPEQILALKTTLLELYDSNSKVGQYIIETVESNPQDLMHNNFPTDLSRVTNLYDYKDKTTATLTTLYENRNNSSKIANIITANIISDSITEKLFGRGDNRGHDGQLIRGMMKNIMAEFIKANPEITVDQILKDEKLSDILTELSNEVKKHTKYTTAGLATGGIYLPDNAITEELTSVLTTKMNNRLGQYRLNEGELEEINKIANQIGVNVFGEDTQITRDEDFKLIRKCLKEAFVVIKSENAKSDISSEIKAKANDIIGENNVTSSWGISSTARTKLTKLFYDNTTRGYSGSLYVDPNKTKTKDFVDLLRLTIRSNLQSGHVSAIKSKQPDISNNMAQRSSSLEM